MLRRNPKRAIALGGLVCLVLWAIALWPDARFRLSDVPAPVAVAVPAPDPQPSTPTTNASDSAAVLAAQADRLPGLRIDVAPLIAEVAQDKTVVCPGEDFEVRATALEGAGEVAFHVDGVWGDAIVLQGARPGVQKHSLRAVGPGGGRDWREVEVQVLPADSPECTDRPLVVLSAHNDPLRSDVAIVEVVSTRNLVEPLSYRWSFGDGSPARQGRRQEEHVYADRAQRAEESTFRITAQVVDARGQLAEGRATVSFRNTYYMARKYTGNRVLPARYSQFAQRVGAGYRVEATLRNIEDRPVRLEQARVTLLPCLEGDAERTVTLPADALLGSTHLKPGASADTYLSVPAELVSDRTCDVHVELSGDTIPKRTGLPMPDHGVPNQPVNVAMRIEVRMPPTEQEGGRIGTAPVQVTDPELLTALWQTMQQTGANRITAAELAQTKGDGPR